MSGLGGFLRRAIGRASAEPRPETPFAAIGDVHGRFDLLTRLTGMIRDRFGESLTIVTVGDYIDRGEASAQVLRHLYRSGHVCLKGNHEDMMLDFLADPENAGPRWLHNGGLQTLASFGVTGVTEVSRPEALLSARDALAQAMGQPLINWVRNLPLTWQSGNLAVVHAAADPALPIAAQDPKTLLWGHRDFGRKARRDDIWVVHGHVVVHEPVMKTSHIAIDTGAYATDRLTAAVFTDKGVEFLST